MFFTKQKNSSKKNKLQKIELLYLTTTISLIFSFGAYQWNFLAKKRIAQKSEVLSCFSETKAKKCDRWRLRNLFLTKINIQKKTFTRCMCEGTVFKKIKIKNSDLRQNNFRISFFSDVLFFKTNLQKSSFEGAVIKNTVFENITLNGVVFQFTTFINVNFKNADMTKALFIGSRFKNSTYDENTKWPFSIKTAKELGLAESGL